MNTKKTNLPKHLEELLNNIDPKKMEKFEKAINKKVEKKEYKVIEMSFDELVK